MVSVVSAFHINYREPFWELECLISRSSAEMLTKMGGVNLSGLDKDAFAAGVQDCKCNMYRLALSMLRNQSDAEDVVSESIVKAYEKIESLHNPHKFKSWMMQIVANESRNLYRRQKRLDYTADTESMNLVQNDEHQELLDCVMRLDGGFREVIVLFYYEQMQIKEIAQILKISEGTVKSRLFRGKEQLRKMLA